MKTDRLPDSLNGLPPQTQLLPRLGLPVMFRLGLFQMGLGIMSVLTLGLLNRIMVSELGVPLVVAAGIIALYQFVAPARIWFGQLSDAKPLFGHHRSGYVWVGTVLFAVLSFVAVQGMWQLGNAAAGGWAWTPEVLTWTGLLGLVFAAYGLAISLSSTPFAALLVDVSEEDDRSKLVGIVWSMLMVGIIIGAIATAVMLRNVENDVDPAFLRAKINQLFLVMPAIVVALAAIATWGVEPKYSRFSTRSTLVEREDQITLGRAVKILTASRQTGLFFSFLLVMSLGLFMQEAVLENYGAEVFAMPPAATTKLNAYFGLGTLLGLSLAGFAIVPRLGKQRTTKLGCLMVAACFALAIAIGFAPDPNPNFLNAAVGLFGFASGITTTGALSLMLDLTAAETAGTFIGAWGLAQSVARASATWLGGIIKSLGALIFANPAAAYGLVFGVEAVAMLAAIALLNRVNVREFQDNAREAIAAVMGSELD